jgi:hypothetical protein
MGVRDLPEGPLRGALREVDTDQGAVREVLSWSPPASEHPGALEHAELTGACRVGNDRLLQCTRTGVLEIDLPTYRVVRSSSHPWMHDVHHAIPDADGRLIVAATGHDSVVWFAGGAAVDGWWFGATDGVPRRWRGGSPPPGFAERYGDGVDLRRVPFDRFKPHRVHPNHLARDGGDLLVTGLMGGELWQLDGAGDATPRVVARMPGPAHDGRVIGELRWFTTTAGEVIALDPRSHRARLRLNLLALDDAPGIPGWCRAVEVVGHTLIVGWTTLRSSRHRELLRRALRGARGTKRPTRIAWYNLRDGKKLGEVEVGGPGGGTIYAIHHLADG